MSLLKSVFSRSSSQNTTMLSADDGLARRKNTSFKITNILPSRPPSNDPDESGEDDPDDSRTEDISDNVDDSVGLVLTARRSSITPMGRHGSAAEVSATMYPISEFGFVDGHSGASTPGQGPVHGPRDRFKVVRIETSAPQKRGRWTCIEYADKNSSTASSSAPAASTSTATATTEATSSESTLTDHDPSALQQQPPHPVQQPQALPTSQQQQQQPQPLPQQQQQQLLSPNTSKIPQNLVEEIESLVPVSC